MKCVTLTVEFGEEDVTTIDLWVKDKKDLGDTRQKVLDAVREVLDRNPKIEDIWSH